MYSFFSLRGWILVLVSFFFVLFCFVFYPTNQPPCWYFSLCCLFLCCWFATTQKLCGRKEGEGNHAHQKQHWNWARVQCERVTTNPSYLLDAIKQNPTKRCFFSLNWSWVHSCIPRTYFLLLFGRVAILPLHARCWWTDRTFNKINYERVNSVHM